MILAIQELFDSRDFSMGDDSSGTTKYIVTGTGDESVASEYVRANTPVYWTVGFNQLVRTSWSITPDGDPTDTERWRAEVTYGVRATSPDTGESSFSFNTGGATEHINNSLQTIASYDGSGSAAPDMKQTIGVTKDGVQGVDILVPTYTFSETHYIDADKVTDAYKKTLRDLTGTVNQSSFRSFSAGEVRFDGASGSARGEDDWEITFTFSVRENVTSDPRFPDFTNVTHRGWEYVWARFTEEVIESAGKKFNIMKPKYVYVEKVYKLTDFSRLNP